MKNLWAFLCGGLFALGLMLSGMSNPAKVLGFLDVFGDWDPTLAVVMLGAIAVTIIPMQKALRQKSPKTLYGEAIQLPTQQHVDAKLLVGSAIFGVGWGLAGICPAPSFSLLALGHLEGLYFIVAMIAGVYLYRYWDRCWAAWHGANRCSK
ncbi:YeeE/YedE family protein [Acinetobacter larvae]|uniref:YeeE/YedE family protein n=1 Tax=Acinetobacter larvae TaxID=1789224 RepID=A0A1B2LWB3_9GAMM|nr:YeeE/YedE family protein [Acinetobacter larvae]AOA57179.1 YeeE/YedE family protein [Acinetobacter larvae]